MKKTKTFIKWLKEQKSDLTPEDYQKQFILAVNVHDGLHRKSAIFGRGL